MIRSFPVNINVISNRTFGRDGYLGGLDGFPALETVFLQVGDVVGPESAFVIAAHYVGLA